MKGILTGNALSPQVGDVAPDFELPALIGGVKKRLRLSEFRGKKSLVLAFYPLNWEAVSAGQMIGYQAQRDRFAAHDAEVVGISVDSIMNTTAWERNIGPFDYPLCSDFWPHGAVASKYSVLQPSGASQRAVFVVDKSGRLAFSRTYEDDTVPPIGDVLEVLNKL